jgi:type I restriction enzyme S subunit
VSELCEITSSKRIFAADYLREGVPFFRGKEITQKYNGAIEVSTELFIARSKFEEIKAKSGAPMPGDLLLTSVGTLGSTYVVRSGDEFYFKDGNITWFRSFRGLDSTYLNYWLTAPDGRAELKKCTIGSSQAAYTIVLLKGMEIELPSLPEQRRVASILSAYDDLIENNTRRIAILEEMARRIYEEWFVRFRFPGHEGVRMVESELGLVPEGWEIAAVEDVTETLGGGTPSKSEPEYWDGGDINWYSPTDLTGARTVFMEESASKITALGLAKSSAKLFPANSVMMTSRATLGVIAVNTTPACTNQGFIVCVPSDRMPLWLLFHWLKANEGEFEGLATGATFKEITKGVFRKIKLAVPAKPTATAFEGVVGPMMALVLRLERKNRNLRTTRDLLLPKLISGELDVSALPEPEALAA